MLTRDLRIRVSKDQYERLINNLHAKNYKTIAHYLRDLGLGKGLLSENLIIENNKMLKEILNLIKEKN